MIRYDLMCDQDHGFESWFQSSTAYDTLQKAGHVTCAVCGSDDIRKAIMAPRLGKGDKEPAKTSETVNDFDQAPVQMTSGPMAAHAAQMEAALVRLKAEVEAKSEDVGRRFAHEARAIHAGDAPERPIIGQATPVEAKALLEDGVPVAPLPFIPTRKTN